MIVFKQNAYRAVSDNDALESRKQVSEDDHRSLFGKWYFGEQGETFKATASFAEIEQPHREIHQLISQALSNKDKNWQDDKEIREAIINDMKGMEIPNNND